jgi:hypothetical protein
MTLLLSVTGPRMVGTPGNVAASVDNTTDKKKKKKKKTAAKCIVTNGSSLNMGMVR